ncbi:MAG: hypothetical protein LBC62_09915, partial [Treponema sp.]|nr:hypothetical protein [Treponema sp.]
FKRPPLTDSASLSKFTQQNAIDFVNCYNIARFSMSFKYETAWSWKMSLTAKCKTAAAGVPLLP